MTSWPGSRRTVPGTPPGSGRTGGYLAIASRRGLRRLPTPAGLARRRWLIGATKFLLPMAAVILLSTIALWPEFERTAKNARTAVREYGAALEGARLHNAHYNGIDEHGRPFTVTAAVASQREADKVDLTTPVGDMTLENGSWINVRAKRGVFVRKVEQLDLFDDVVLYRDDGTTLTTQSATVEIKAGAASGAQPTHVEGPFGTLDAAGFTTLEKGAVLQFWGPARVELNGVSQ